jgi:UDP-2,4-diacetamido-2,4,6-trideoxy-beta-L-altropyranose hydrolase
MISLRPVTIGDLQMVFHWRNDPFIIAHGSSGREVAWDEHEKWFTETIADSNRRMFIIVDHDEPIGQIRFDRETRQHCVVSVYLLRSFTARGLGVDAIRTGCGAIFQTWDVERVVACVRQDNPCGRSAFLKAGFHESESGGKCPPAHYSLILSRRLSAD